MDHIGGKLDRIDCGVPYERSEVHRERKLVRLVGGMALEEGRVGTAATEGGEIVALSSCDL